MRKILWLAIILCELSSVKVHSEAQNEFFVDNSDEVSIYLAWSDQFQFAGYYAAKELGFYEEEGLDVQLISGTQLDNVQAVLEKGYEYAVGTGGLLISNKRLNELAVIAVFMQQSPVSLLTLKSSNINTLQDLEDKDIIGGAEIRLMLASAGVDLQTVRFHGLFTSHDNLINGTYDAIPYYITDHFKYLGSDSLLFKSFRPIEYGVNFYGECLFTSRNEIRDNPERVEKMRNATIKGWEYAAKHPEKIIDIILEKYNSGLNREQLEEEAEVTIHSLMQPQFYDVGDMQHSKWNQMANMLWDFGIIDHQPDLTGFVYDPAGEQSSKLKLVLNILWIVLAVGGAILLLLLLYNWQLKKAVKARTRSLERTNLELDRFVYSVSHDIKSPLSSINGILNLMKLDPAGQEKYLELIESSIDQLNNFTSEILDYSRNSRMELASNPVEINHLIESSIEELRYLDHQNKIKFIKEFENNGVYYTDEWRLKIIVGNLISNAIKYQDIEKESSYVKIKTSSNKREFIIDIEDNGIGIEPQHLDKIYDMFYRATEESKGSGLGLYIVNETVKVLKGKINIESEYKQGTRINLEIPISTNGTS